MFNEFIIILVSILLGSESCIDQTLRTDTMDIHSSIGGDKVQLSN